MIKCWEIMRRPLRDVGPTADLASISRWMRDEKVGFFPVVDAHGAVAGVVTDRDIVVRACAQAKLLPDTHVSEIMSRDIVSCRAEDDLTHAIELMKRAQKSRVVVVDGENRLVGVLSMTDIAQYAEPQAISSLVRTVSAREFRVANANSWRPPRNLFGMGSRW